MLPGHLSYLQDILTCRHTHPPHSRASRHFDLLPGYGTLLFPWNFFQLTAAASLSSHLLLPLPPRLPPSSPSHRLRGHLGSFLLELGSDSSNRFLVTPPREAFPPVGTFSLFPFASAACGLASSPSQHQPSAGSRLSIQRVRLSLPPGRDQGVPVLDAVYRYLLYKVPYYIVSTL